MLAKLWKTQNKTQFIAPAILTLGALLRVLTLSASALWYDESVTLFRTSVLPFMQTYTNQTDNSGCLLLELILRPLLLLGHPIWLLRLPSLLAGLASLWLVWLLMRELQFTPLQQTLAALFVAFLPGALWIGQDARVYGLLALVFLAGFWFALQGRTLGLTACMGLVIYCHNTGPVWAAAALAIALYTHPWKYRRLLLAGGIAALAWLPALAHVKLMSLTVFGIFQPWAAHLTVSWFSNAFLQALWVTRNHAFIFAAFLLALASLGLLWSRCWKSLPRNALLMAWGIPILVLVLGSLFLFNIVMYRTLMPMVYPLGLFLGWEFGHSPHTRYRLVMAALWTFGLLAGGTLWRPADRGAHLDRAAAYIRSEWQPGDVLVYATQTAALPFSYYLNDLPHYNYPLITHDPLMNEPGLPLIDTADPAQAQRVWLVQPKDALITAAERTALEAAYPHDQQLWRIEYLQAAKIDIYLVEK